MVIIRLFGAISFPAVSFSTIRRIWMSYWRRRSGFRHSSHLNRLYPVINTGRHQSRDLHTLLQSTVTRAQIRTDTHDPSRFLLMKINGTSRCHSLYLPIPSISNVSKSKQNYRTHDKFVLNWNANWLELQEFYKTTSSPVSIHFAGYHGHS